MSVINTNVKALVAQESMRSNNLKLSSAMERLSTGLRINSAKDDAAGLAISNRMTAQIRGMAMATRNANDGISMAQTADGAYGQVTSMLQRMRELSVQAATGSATNSDRESIQLEIDELKAEINNVAKQTNFNGIKLLDGSAQNIQLQTGTNQGDSISVGFGSVQANDIGSGLNPALTSVGGVDGTFAAFVAGQLLLNGVQVGASLAEDDPNSVTTPEISAIAKVAAINRVAEQSGVFARVNANQVAGSVMTVSAGTTSSTVSINGIATASFSLSTTNTETNRVTVAKAINDLSAQTGVRAVNTGDDNKGIQLVADDGRNIDVALGAIHTAAETGLAATDTYVGTYSLYSNTNSPILVEHGAGTATAFARIGLNAGTYDSSVASMVTTVRANAATGTAPSTTTTGVLNGNTLEINGLTIRGARATDDTASHVITASTKAASAIAIAAAINERSAETGVTAKASANVLRSTAVASFTAGTSGSLFLNGVTTTVNTLTRDNVIEDINKVSGRTGVVAREYGAGIELVAEDGRNITLGGQMSAANLGLSGVNFGGGVAASTAGTAVAHYSTVTLTSEKAFEVSHGSEGPANFALLGFRVGTFGGADTGVKIAEVDVSTQLGAQIALTAIDAAIEDVSSSQARSGAFQNRLEAVVSVLGESSENMSAARSRITDTDYAQETTALAKAQIVQQAATAMLAQANQQQQSVLALLQ